MSGFNIKPPVITQPVRPPAALSPDDRVGLLVLPGTNEPEVMDREHLHIVQDLGQGTFAKVRLAEYRGHRMARKELNAFEAVDNPRATIRREIDVLRESNECPQIVRFFGVCEQDSIVHLYLEYMDVGSLRAILSRTKGGVPSEPLQFIAHQVLQALTFLHTRLTVVHRDVKPSNVLLNSRAEVKICDFGISKKISRSAADTYVGTFQYMAPERITREAIAHHDDRDFKSDVWSLGLTLCEAALGVYPYPRARTQLGSLTTIVNNDPPLIHAPWIAYDLALIIRLCLTKDPTDRPRSDELLDRFQDTWEATSRDQMQQWLATIERNRDEQ